MATIILAFILLLVTVTIMSIGVIMGRKPIAGSCGGMANLGMDTACDICGGDPDKCDEGQLENNKSKDNSELAYEAK